MENYRLIEYDQEGNGSVIYQGTYEFIMKIYRVMNAQGKDVMVQRYIKPDNWKSGQWWPV